MGLFVTKNGNSWELLCTVVTDSFVFNVTKLLDPTLTGVDKFKLRCSRYSNKVFYLVFTCSKSAKKPKND